MAASTVVWPTSVRRRTMLQKLPPIGQLLKLYGVRSRKELSQNFLLDLRITDKIIRRNPYSFGGSEVIEVGPGPGSLTRSLLSAGASRIVLIEKDRRFLPMLDMLNKASDNRLELYLGDVLNFNMDGLFSEEMSRPWDGQEPKLHVVGNLPFSVATPLTIQWFEAMSRREGVWACGRVPLLLCYQSEVADRMVAPATSAIRCRMSVMAQNWCIPRHVYSIPGAAFTPRPKVDSTVVSLTPRVQPHIDLSFATVEKFMRVLFSARRKLVRFGISRLFPRHIAHQACYTFYTLTYWRIAALSMDDIKHLAFAFDAFLQQFPELLEFESRQDVLESNRALAHVICERWTCLPSSSEARPQIADSVRAAHSLTRPLPSDLKPFPKSYLEEDDSSSSSSQTHPLTESKNTDKKTEKTGVGSGHPGAAPYSSDSVNPNLFDFYVQMMGSKGKEEHSNESRDFRDPEVMGELTLGEELGEENYSNLTPKTENRNIKVVPPPSSTAESAVYSPQSNFGDSVEESGSSEELMEIGLKSVPTTNEHQNVKVPPPRHHVPTLHSKEKSVGGFSPQKADNKTPVEESWSSEDLMEIDLKNAPPTNEHQSIKVPELRGKKKSLDGFSRLFAESRNRDTKSAPPVRVEFPAESHFLKDASWRPAESCRPDSGFQHNAVVDVLSELEGAQFSEHRSAPADNHDLTKKTVRRRDVEVDDNNWNFLDNSTVEPPDRTFVPVSVTRETVGKETTDLPRNAAVQSVLDEFNLTVDNAREGYGEEKSAPYLPSDEYDKPAFEFDAENDDVANSQNVDEEQRLDDLQAEFESSQTVHVV